MEKVVSFSFNSIDRYEEFVRNYYSLLETHPENLQRFYGASSKLSRPGPDGKMSTFSTLSEIHEKVQSFGPKYHRMIVAVCPQVCGNKYGLVVLVTGQVVRKEDNASRNFAQTFFLAVDSDGTFYILNDVFNYVDEPRVAVPEVVSVSSSSTRTVTEVGAGGAGGVQTPLKVASYASKISNGSAPVSPTSTASNSSSSAGKKLVLLKPRPPSAPQVAAEKVVAPPVTDQQESLKSPSAPAAAEKEKRVEHPVSNGGNRSQPLPQAPAQQVNNSGGNNRSQAANEEKSAMYAVLVTRLPLCTQRYQIETLFKKFGTIKQDGGVQVKNHRNDEGEPDYKYAFVEFEQKSSMEAALKASPITVNNRPFPVIRRRW